MKRGVYAFALLALFMVSVVSAADTMIKIKTLPEHDIDIYALRVGETYNLIESFHKKSDSNGSVSVVLSTNEEKFILRVGVRKENTMIVSEKFNKTYTSGETVGVEIYPEWYWEQVAIEQSGNFANGENASAAEKLTEENISDSAVVNETEDKQTPDSSAITGFFTSMKDKVSGKASLYVIVFILLVGVFWIFFTKKRRSYHEPPEPKEIIVRKLSEINDAKKNLIEEAEKKIAGLHEEIKKIRGG